MKYYVTADVHAYYEETILRRWIPLHVLSRGTIWQTERKNVPQEE